MLFSTLTLKEKINDWKKSQTDAVYFEQILSILTVAELENSQNEKPFLIFVENEKALILYTDNELWSYLLELRRKDMSNLGLPEVAKMWVRLKEILKREPKVL